MNLFKVLIAMFVLAISINGSSAQTGTSAEVGKQAPAFTLKGVDGKMYNLSDFKGKYVVLEWINFDCPFVKKHYGSNNMQKLQKYATQKGVVWLSICSSAEGKQGNFSQSEIKKHISDLKANMTAYLIDESGVTGKLYGARTTPNMFIINPDGKLIYQGAIDNIKSADATDIPKSKNYISAALDEAMAGKKVTDSSTQPYGCGVKYKD